MSYMHDGKSPEEVDPIDTKHVMLDTHYLLLQQCVRDARSLYVMLEHFSSGSSHGMSDWRVYERNIVKMATVLFIEHSKNPVTPEQLKEIMSVGSSSVEILNDIKFQNEEYMNLVQEINTMSQKRDSVKREISQIETTTAKLKSEDFLRHTVGDALRQEFVSSGKLRILGTNGAVYVIDKDGDIQKVKHGLMGTSTKWEGCIHPGDYPMNDAIATVVIHIRKDSDKFDEDKGCGNISIR